MGVMVSLTVSRAMSTSFFIRWPSGRSWTTFITTWSGDKAKGASPGAPNPTSPCPCSPPAPGEDLFPPGKEGWCILQGSGDPTACGHGGCRTHLELPLGVFGVGHAHDLVLARLGDALRQGREGRGIRCMWVQPPRAPRQPRAPVPTAQCQSARTAMTMAVVVRPRPLAQLKTKAARASSARVVFIASSSRSKSCRGQSQDLGRVLPPARPRGCGSGTR